MDNVGCMIIIRSRFAKTPWEQVCKSVVGDPVHMDIVLVQPGDATACFCFSAYMQERFDMNFMDDGLLLDESMKNHRIYITEREWQSCSNFLHRLVKERARYDYVDALFFMPASGSSAWLRRKVADVQDAASISRVFCSQSVVLMLRECLDSQGIHKDLLERLQSVNSRLASPRQVHNLLLTYEGSELISNKEVWSIAKASAKRQMH